MHLAAGGAGTKITGFDLQNRHTNASCSETFKSVNAFFFANVLVNGTLCRPDWRVNQIKTQFAQSNNVTKRFFQMLRVTTQKMPSTLTGHFGIFGFCFELFSCHDNVFLWKSPDQSTTSKGFQCAAKSAPPLPP